ncbi:glycerophosphodiester phosphodiesterase [Candidatus Litorirhabdus singularis]|nr:glycerophosphodiester phosphodiesterase family protein [Candidatus Litorirhabdus singularis]
MIVYGHRGARGEAPENTIAGCQHAVARGVRHLEIDLHLSRDKQLVVVHDSTLRRTTGVAGKIADLTAAQLARLDARQDGTPWPNKRGTGIPTLSKLMAAVPEIKSWQLELKPGKARYNSQLADAVCEFLSTSNRGRIVTSSDAALVHQIKNRLPDLDTGLVSSFPDPQEILQQAGCNYLIAGWNSLTNSEQIKRLQKQGIQISAWTVNDASAITNLHRMGVDSVISDYPSMAMPLVAALER